MAGSLFSDVVACIAIPRVELKHVYRTNGKTIVDNANKVREGDVGLSCDQYFSISTCGNDMTEITERYMELYQKKPDDVVIISPGNKEVQHLNERIHAMIHQEENKRVPFCVSMYPGKSWKLFIGDRVMNTKNLNSRIVNGSIGTITGISVEEQKVDHVKITVEYLDSSGSISSQDYIFQKTKQTYLQGKLLPAYVLTIHKTQGCEYDHVLVYLTMACTYWLRRDGLYTAITRAKKTCYIYTSSTDVLPKLITNSPTNRVTYLATLFNKIYRRRKRKHRDDDN